MSDPVRELRDAVERTAAGLRDGADEGASAPNLERPPKPDLGDFSTNAAMLLAPALGEQPREIAGRLAEGLEGSLGEDLEKVEVAGPGFINLFLADGWYRRAAAGLLAAGDELGRPGAPDDPESVLVEFVSANPTGPVTAASGRRVDNTAPVTSDDAAPGRHNTDQTVTLSRSDAGSGPSTTQSRVRTPGGSFGSMIRAPKPAIRPFSSRMGIISRLRKRS